MQFEAIVVSETRILAHLDPLDTGDKNVGMLVLLRSYPEGYADHMVGSRP